LSKQCILEEKLINTDKELFCFAKKLNNFDPILCYLFPEMINSGVKFAVFLLKIANLPFDFVKLLKSFNEKETFSV